MNILSKYYLKFFTRFVLICGTIQFSCASASKIEKECKSSVGTYCSSNAETCKAYCKAKKLEDCDCNAQSGLCKVNLEGYSADEVTELDQLNLARYAACIEEKNAKKLWQRIMTANWLLLTADPKEKLKPGEFSVRDAVKVSENLVNQECIQVHAPKYCQVKEITDCDPVVLCKSLPKELKAQVEAQLMACIAAKRDPSARKTGRPEYTCKNPAILGKKPIPWCSINSPSWREGILYPDPEKAAKKERYLKAIKDAEDNGKDQKWIDKNIVLEKSLGQEIEEKIEAGICSDAQTPVDCRDDTGLSSIGNDENSVGDDSSMKFDKDDQGA